LAQIKLFITILGLCGTDFTRNLPLISPQKIWAALPLVVQTFRMEAQARIHMAQGKRIIELLYAEAFPKHIDTFSKRSVWSQAQVIPRFALCVLHGHADGVGSQASKLGQRNKALIPTDARIACTLRNLNFLLAYWLEFQAPDPVQDFGFRLDDRGAVVAWDD
jgi:hypothetical protein